MMGNPALLANRIGLIMDFLGIMLVVLELYGHDLVMSLKPPAQSGNAQLNFSQGQSFHFQFIPLVMSFILELALLLLVSSLIFFLPVLCLVAMVNALTPSAITMGWAYVFALCLSFLGIAGFVAWQLKPNAGGEDMKRLVWRKMFIYLMIFYYILYSFILTLPASFRLVWDNLWQTKKSPSFVGLIFLVLGFFLHLVGTCYI